MQETPRGISPNDPTTNYQLPATDATPRLKKYVLPVSVIAVILFLDQLVKFWIKLTFAYQEHRAVLGHWFYLYFIENEGMAFGITWGGAWGKLLLTLFRLVAVVALGYWLKRLLETRAHKGLIVCVAMIIAGAFGNIIDSVFYGVIFSESTGAHPAILFHEHYGTLLHGRVVDMFYFPIWEGYLPRWIPIWGGTYFTFFDAIFNVADASISVGVMLLLIFQSVFFKDEKRALHHHEMPNAETVTPTNSREPTQ